jgi:diaminopimelate decarboxylase
MKEYYTQVTGFYRGSNPAALVERFGSPLYVYSEEILRRRCREVRQLSRYPHFAVNYSVKANANLSLLEIIRSEGLNADAMSPGEIHVLLAAGFRPEQIFYVCNNVSVQEMAFAVERGITVGLDSLSQLETFGKAFPGYGVAVRFNMGYGAGHHEKVVTAGKKTKFGIDGDLAGEVKALLKKYHLKLRGINQHIGSLFLEESAYIASAGMIMELALSFDPQEFIDLGGGFGIPYMKQHGQNRLDLGRWATGSTG